MTTLQPLVYLLCAVTSAICMILLVRGYLVSRTKLLLWSAICFVGLAANNLLLFVDVVVLPDVDLIPLRTATALFGISALLYGFISETD